MRLEYNKATNQTTEVFISEGEYNSETSNGTQHVIGIEDDGNGGDAIGTVCDQSGKVLHHDNNANVYMNDGNTARKIGQWGGDIDASTIIFNILADNKIDAKTMNETEWVSDVARHALGL